MKTKSISFNTKNFRNTLKTYGLTVSEANALTGKNLNFWEYHLRTGKVDRASLTLFRAKIKLLKPKTEIEDPTGAYMDCLNSHSCTPDEIILTKRLLEMVDVDGITSAGASTQSKIFLVYFEDDEIKLNIKERN